MKKIIILGLVLTFIAPHIVLAAWWNPFSWSIFNRKDQKTMILENKVKELENRLNNKESEIQKEETFIATSTSKIDISRPPVVNTTASKAVVAQQNTSKTVESHSVKPSVGSTVNTDDLFNTINIKINKLFDIRELYISLENTKDIAKSDKGLLFTKQTEINATIRDATQDKTNYSKIIAQSNKSDLSKHITYLNSLISDLDKKISIFNSDYIATKNNISKNIEADKISAVSSQIEISKDKLNRMNAINLEIANLNAKRAKDLTAINEAYGSESSKQTSISNINRIYNTQYDTLMAEFQLIKYSN